MNKLKNFILKEIKYDYNHKVILFILFLVISSVFIYGKLRCLYLKDFEDPLQFKLKIWDLDGWSLTHIHFFFWIGFIFPDYFVLSFIYGVIWELFEFYYGHYKPKILYGWGNCDTEQGHEKIWWYGKFTSNFKKKILNLYHIIDI